MPLVNRQILVVGTEFWSGPLLSKHHIVLELCKQNRVLYLEPVYHAGSILRGQRQVMQYPFLYHELHPAGLQRLRPWWLPKSDRPGLMRRLSETLVRLQARRAMARPDLILSFSPDFPFLGQHPPIPFVYFCVDTQVQPNREAETLSRADLVVAGTEKLLADFQGRARQVRFLPHGVSVTLLQTGREALPPEMAGIPHPIAGFVGAVSQHIDLPLLLTVAWQNPTVSFVLVGPYVAGDFGANLPAEAIARLQAQPNLYLLGPKRSDELGRYINQFDVGLIPYDLAHFRIHFSFHKVLQYLALGKPVATTVAPPPELEVPALWVGTDPAGFNAALRTALEQAATKADAAAAFAKQHSWQQRVEQLSAWLADTAG